MIVFILYLLLSIININIGKNYYKLVNIDKYY